MPIYTVQSITSVVSVSADCVPRAKVSPPNRRPCGHIAPLGASR